VARQTARTLLVLIVALAAAVAVCGCGHQAAERNRAAEQQSIRAIRTIGSGISDFTVDHNDTYPAARLVVEATTVPHFFGYYPPETVGCYLTGQWPNNPFTGEPMRQGTSAGDFTYVELGFRGDGLGCEAYRLTVYGAHSKPLLVEGDNDSDWDEALSTETQQLNWLVRYWTQQHRGICPSESMVDQAALGAHYTAKKVMNGTSDATFVWPANPFDGRPLRPGNAPGDYRYQRIGTHRYELIVYDRHDAAAKVTQYSNPY
jgi:hypothetical protein